MKKRITGVGKMKRNKVAVAVFVLFALLKLLCGPNERLVSRAEVWLGWETERVEALGRSLLGDADELCETRAGN